ncbi:hypothetical protein ACFQ1S_42445, partial [Kibdelosporangium lantanae]
PDHECRTWDDSTGVAVPCPKSLDVPPCSAPPRSVSAYTRNHFVQMAGLTVQNFLSAGTWRWA